MQNDSKKLNRELLRLVIAGSVDDGKSTLIGRLFYDCNAIYEDQLLAIKNSSANRGKDKIDLSLFTDGLSAEREQGITIDVAYRYFNTPKRRIIMADVPGHEQYTRNMVTGASSADVALILVDAKNGLTIQSKRHLFITSLLGISHIVIVVNKMDAVGYSQVVFEKIKNDFSNYASKLNIKDLQFIPVSALKGDMIVERGDNMSWYGGDTLLYYLENMILVSNRNLVDFRLPIQSVIRASSSRRGYAGKISSGVIRKGENIMVLPSGKESSIKSILVAGEKREYAFASQSVLIQLTDEIDISRGDMVIRKNNAPEANNELDVMLCWLDEEKLQLNKSYLIKHTTKITRCVINELRYHIDINTLHRKLNKVLRLNDIGRAVIKTNEPLMHDTYTKNKSTGSFILIDEITSQTVAAGIILNKAKKSTKEKKNNKAELKREGAVLWFTGLSGSGKSTIADKLFRRLQSRGVFSERLDGDIVRQSLTKDLGFSAKDRDENIKRVSYVAGLLSKHGVIVLATFISPYKKHRKLADKASNNFIEIFVDAPLEVCRQRDIKGLYKKASQGEIKNFTGVSDSYEKPKKPDIHLRTDQMSVDECVDEIIKYLEDKKLI